MYVLKWLITHIIKRTELNILIAEGRKFMTDIKFKNGLWLIDYIPVKNPLLLVKYLKEKEKYTDEKIQELCSSNGGLTLALCPIHYVLDGDYAFICGYDLVRKTPTDKCHCGVPLDVHGTCCGWNNAKHVCDDHLVIVDNRHPFYGKNFNEYLNQRAGGN